MFNHHAHLLACATDGGFVPTGDGPSAFLPARLITQADLATLTEKVGLRVVRSFRMQRLIEGLNQRPERVVSGLEEGRAGG